ncbi:ATP-binding protein [Acuticoccus sp. I52.16.1]|uniref:ATP-binding protein n=1 Tax=Acuticoccus sp. I52.16.1 TaxID=2928472 RepID=UPI001FD370AB|nr:ATP-binding protein [Acuticoccus sp. I52.16.1]UOM32903.1 ATP-binding protein [Acuticoccus sp. I52.16.1]
MSAAIEFRLTTTDELTALLDAVEAFGEAQDLPVKTVMTLNLVLEELVTNAIHYGAGPNGAVVDVWAELRDARVYGCVRDNGIAFNPLTARMPDTEAPIEERPIGGLGLYIVREMAHNLDYQREGAENVLKFQLSVQEG